LSEDEHQHMMVGSSQHFTNGNSSDEHDSEDDEEDDEDDDDDDDEVQLMNIRT
jgi:hypothetical protein